ncbi:hypothetical protein TM48_05266 [Mycobacterium shottsii]|nr:hypothetical protein TM48_05266 [Mycobacterium shottsii]
MRTFRRSITAGSVFGSRSTLTHHGRGGNLPYAVRPAGGLAARTGRRRTGAQVAAPRGAEANSALGFSGLTPIG